MANRVSKSVLGGGSFSAPSDVLAEVVTDFSKTGSFGDRAANMDDAAEYAVPLPGDFDPDSSFTRNVSYDIVQAARTAAGIKNGTKPTYTIGGLRANEVVEVDGKPVTYLVRIGWKLNSVKK